MLKTLVSVLEYGIETAKLKENCTKSHYLHLNYYSAQAKMAAQRAVVMSIWLVLRSGILFINHLVKQVFCKTT